MAAHGVDYRQLARTSAVKKVVRKALLYKVVNRVVTGTLSTLPDYRWKTRIPVRGHAVLRLPGAAEVTLMNPERCEVAKEVFWAHGSLARACDRLALQLATDLGAEADLFLDIGAYTGMFALAVARRNPQIRCEAFEIVGDNFLLMWENVLRNDLVTRVQPKLVAIGAQTGTLRVPSSLGNGTLASSVALDSDSEGGVQVPIATLDGLYAGFTGRAVFKIDVEGFEWDVFRGGAEMVRRVKPDIVCEVLRRAPNVPEMEQFLRGAGYNIFHITNEGLKAAERIVAVKHERDWLFTTRPAEELRQLGFAVS